MRHILAELEPLDPATGERVTLRVASAEDWRITGMNDQTWWPGITEMPTRSISLFDGDFSGNIDPGGANLTILLSKLVKQAAGARSFRWASARVRLYAGTAGAAWADWETAFVGIVDKFDGPPGSLRLSLKVDDSPFAADVLKESYAGTGDDEGGDDLKGQLKPLILGRARNVEGVLVDVVNSVIQFSAYGPIQAVAKLYERASDFGPAVANYATYAELVAATIAPGKWATCLNRGMIRLGAPPAGVITADIDGHWTAGTWPRLTGAIISRAAAIAGVDPALIDDASLDGLDDAVAFPVNIVITEQTSVLDLAQRMARPCNAQAGVSWLGKLFVVRISMANPVARLDFQGRGLPPVISAQEADVSPPYWRIAFGAERCWRVHTLDEIASEYPLVLRGRYDATKTYRQGNIVDLADGSQWEYINATPAAGHAPAEGIWWTNITPALTADGIRYVDEDGNPAETVQEMKPAEPGATNSANPDSPLGPTQTVAEVLASLQGVVDRAEQAISDIVDLATAIFKNTQLDEFTREANNLLTHIDGEPAKVVLSSRIDTVEDGQTAQAQKLDLIGAVNDAGNAFVLNGTTVKVSPTQTLAEYVSSVASSFDGVGDQINSAINSYNTAITGPTGAIAAMGTTVTTAYRNDMASTVLDFSESQSNDDGTRTAALTRLESRHGMAAKSAAATLYETVLGPDGGLAHRIDTVDLSIGELSGKVTTLNEVVIDESGVTARAVLAVVAGDKIGGIYLTATNELTVLKMLWDSYELYTPGGGLIFHAVGDVVYMPNVIVQRLDINTAVVPAYYRWTDDTVGSGTNPIVLPSTDDWSRTLEIPVQEKGIIKITFNFTQGFSGEPAAWRAFIRVNGIEQRSGGGVNSEELCDLFWIHEVDEPATVSIEAAWRAHEDVTLLEGVFYVEGNPFSQIVT